MSAPGYQVSWLEVSPVRPFLLSSSILASAADLEDFESDDLERFSEPDFGGLEV